MDLISTNTDLSVFHRDSFTRTNIQVHKISKVSPEYIYIKNLFPLICTFLHFNGEFMNEWQIGNINNFSLE